MKNTFSFLREIFNRPHSVVTVIALALALLLLAPASAAAHPHHGPGAVLGFLVERLELTAEQREEITGILEVAREDLRPLAEASAAVHRELMATTFGESFDETAVRALAPDLAAAEGDFAVGRALVAEDVFAVLTPEQRAELEEWWARLAARRDGFGGGDGSPGLAIGGPGRGSGGFGRGAGGFGRGGEGGRGRGGHFGRGGRGPGSGPGGSFLRPILRHLDLTADQRQAIEAIRDASRPAAEAAREAHRSARQELREAVHSGGVDEPAIRAAADALAAAEVDLALVRGADFEDIRALLTPEQLALLEELREGRRGPRGG